LLGWPAGAAARFDKHAKKSLTIALTLAKTFAAANDKGCRTNPACIRSQLSRRMARPVLYRLGLIDNGPVDAMN
jgi:hypothetical protein